jgi:MFS family permease
VYNVRGDAALSENRLSPHKIERAVRLSYAQAMLASVYAASTGGMFIIGYALKLGADDVQLGLMSTIPMFAVVTQLLSAAIIERGASRRRMTIMAAMANVSGWALIIMLPYAMARLSADVRIGALIGVITLVTVFAHMAGNARGSWLGDLIPEERRGGFFGKSMMYAGIIGAVFAIVEGRFLDYVKRMGIGAFSWLFAFGMLFGIVNALLFVPQSDVKAEKHEHGGNLPVMILETLRNRALMVVVVYAALWSMQTIAAPFYATYSLRDLKIPFFGFGLVNSAVALTVLASGPFWGRVVDRYGCKPVLTACTLSLVPAPLVWFFVASPLAFYAVVGPVNLLVGLAIGGFSVALNTLVYKVTPSAGRSVQLALYSVLVVIPAAPMPFVGGHLPGWLHALGIHADLHCTFYASAIFVAAAAFASRYIREPGSRAATEMVSNLPGHIRRPATLKNDDQA